MDDEFFQMSPGSILWMEMEEAHLVINQYQNVRNHDMNNSAFSVYTNLQQQPQPSDRGNVHTRMLHFLRNRQAMRTTPTGGTVSGRQQRNVQKIMGERLRRRQHREGYEVLLQLLPAGTKNDQKSILEMTVKEITKLQRYKEELEKNLEISHTKTLAATEKGKSAASSEVAEIKLKVTNPASGIDSMLDVLNCLKATGSTVRSIESHFSDHEFSAALQLQTKIMRAEDVEKTVKKTLYHTERKLRDKALQ